MTETTAPDTRKRGLGLPVLALIGLAALAVPRLILHDLRILTDGPVVVLLAIVPIVVWIVVALVARVPNPFLTLLVVGLFYGGFLLIGHQILWDQAFDGAAPDLGGPLGGVVPRIAASFSSILTGAGTGAVAGLIAWGISALLKLGSRPRV
jgi:hypothetical protein